MNKYNKNLIKLALIASLFAACALTGKARLESSVQDITDEIDKAVKEAKQEGAKLDAITEQKAGVGVAGPKIKAAKIRVIALTQKFLKEIEEEAIKLKGSEGSDELSFSEMYELMSRTAKKVEEIGVLKMSGTVKEAAEATDPTTAEGILEIAKKMKQKLVRIEGKNATT
ncbi:decorin-binding protein DbpA [Borreliella tanukii]|uniref:decorin-binding protein DbpA n=1 Tax=Borreliella tanukii TaxID=56146 RepID=UPI0026488D17|nr:decorin-binding protein DbpA [Borreliella tanukii]WKC79390.1 decorin-binding protein DbpA [Borreliella tanukii]